jgi:hypothetical protein
MSELGISVRVIAKQIVKINEPYYTDELIKLIPDNILDVMLSGDNLHQTSITIDEKLIFPKQHEFATMLGIDSSPLNNADKEIIYNALNAKINSLPDPQEQSKREIKFLFNVSATILHQ